MSASGSSDSGATSGTVVGGNISAMTVGDSGATVSFDSLTDDESVMLLLYSYSDSSSSAAFEISSSVGDQPTLPNSSQLMAENEEPLDLSGELRSILDEAVLEMDPNAVLTGGVSSALAKVSKAATIGSTKTFKVLNSFSNSSSYDTVTATLRLENSEFQFYVDARNAGDLDDSDIDELATDFLAMLDQERTIFGSESDINSDGKFAVLFTQTVNELGASAGGMVTGFFYAADLFDTSQYAISNEMEVFYTFVPDPDGNYGTAVSKAFGMSNIYPGVLPHEFQHMINFNQHYLVNGGSTEESWLNEGLSHLAEDLANVNADGYMTGVSMENPARVSGYLADISNLCFSCGTNLYQRGGVYLFLRYLYEQAQQGAFENVANGAALVQSLVNTNLRGVANVVHAVYGDTATEADFETLLGLFGLAVYLSDTGATDDARFAFEGIDLRATQNDNRGTVLNGPAIQEPSAFPFTDAITGSSVSYIQFSGADINAAGGSLNLTFSSSATFGGFVIRE